MSQCKFCNATLGLKARFCSACGSPVTEASATSYVAAKFAGASVSDASAMTATKQSNSKFESLTYKKIVKPNAVSIGAIRHTLFVLPEYFSDSLEKILKTFEVEAAGIVCSSNGSCVVDRCQQAIRDDRAGSIRYVCIIGNWDDVPPLNVPNDFGLDDGDAFCQSDAFFGATQTFNPEDPFTAIPDIPVGRIPIADFDIVQRVLGSDPEVAATRNVFQFGVTAQCWEVASKEIVSSFPNLVAGGPNALAPQDVKRLPKAVLISSPQWTEHDFRRVASSGPADPFGLIYLNVHGGPDEPEWVGEGEFGGYVRIFEPGTVVDFNSALLVSEACYGGALSYSSPSIVEHFFTCRGHSFVGSSTIAYGAKATPISAADLIAKHYVLGLYDGLTNGEALKLAKMEVLAEDPLSLEYAFKTVLSFNLFGAPWQTLVRHSMAATLTQPVSGRPTGGSVLNRVRTNLQSPAPIGSSTLNKIREEYRSRLPARNRQFIVQSSEILTKLREFKDFSRIMEEVSKWGARLDDLKLDFVSAGSVRGYRLICTVNEPKKSKSMLILITDSNGQLTKTLVSKGGK
jgi:hypothetical protein